MIDHSQAGEQAAILKALGYPADVEPTPGMQDERLAWDIGAWAPTQLSNSRALIELGWSAVLIEPSPRPMAGLIEEYGFNNRVQLVQAAVAINPGLMDMWISDDAVSTSNDAEHDLWKDNAKYIGKLLVPTINLEHIANRFGGAAFCNIDAEGSSAELALRMLELGYFPKCWCAEHDGRGVELMAAASRHGYHCVFANDCNAIFAR